MFNINARRRSVRYTCEAAVLAEVREVEDSDGILGEVAFLWRRVDSDENEIYIEKMYDLEHNFSSELFRILEDWLGDELYDFVDDDGNLEFQKLVGREAVLVIKELWDAMGLVAIESVDSVRDPGEARYSSSEEPEVQGWKD